METQATCDCSSQNDCNKKMMMDNQSRRSIDWRDSGIVVDEDGHLLQSFGLCNFNTGLSVQSGCDLMSFSTQPTESVAAATLITATSATTATTATATATKATTTNTTTNTNLTTDPALNTGCPMREMFVGQDDDGDTMLHLAAVGLAIDKTRDLVNLCDLNAINNMMQTPLHVAVLANRPEMVELFVASGAKLNTHDRRGNTPLHLACQAGLTDIVKIILDATLRDSNHTETSVRAQDLIETCNFDGLTCLHLAALRDRRDIIDILVRKYKVNPNVRDSKSGETVMHKAIRQFNVDLITFLVNLDCQHCNEADYSGREPLSTIKILQNALTTDEARSVKLDEIKQLVKDGIERCISRGGCCLERHGGKSLDADLSDSTDYSSSGSDPGDSDYEMN